MGNLEFVSIDFWTLIFTWVNLIILFLLVKKLLFKPVKKMLAERNEQVEKLYTDAETAVSKANEMKNDYEQKLSGAKEEAKNIVSQANRTAEQNCEKMIKQTKEQTDKMVERALAQIENEKRAAGEEVKNEVASMAVMVAQKVIEREINEKDCLDLAEKCIEEMGDDK